MPGRGSKDAPALAPVHDARGGADRRRRRAPARRRQALILSQPACQHRTLVSNTPFYGAPDDKLYAVKPLLHEPDPKAISWWQSPTGLAFRKGERLKVTAAYDNTRPHTRVMGISHLYVAPPLPGAPDCPLLPAPPDATEPRRRVRAALQRAAEGRR